jgi:hypothetical protein
MAQFDGELAWPDRFDQAFDRKMAYAMGDYGYASQYQQSPVPFLEKEENDPTGCTTWGLWTDPTDGFPKVMLLAAWRKHLPLHGVEQEPRKRNETEEEYLRRVFPHWGIVEYLAWSAGRFGGADVVLVEAKASGLDVINEVRRLYTQKMGCCGDQSGDR